MNKCCNNQNSDKTNTTRPRICPQDGSKGKPVQLITLKSLLKPSVLEQLEPQQSYSFCNSSDCAVVYFSENGSIFTIDDIKVPVFQKNSEEEILVCYCFNWTGRRIRETVDSTGKSIAITSISAHIKAGRCGCKVNNPQGSCCLANVKQIFSN